MAISRAVEYLSAPGPGWLAALLLLLVSCAAPPPAPPVPEGAPPGFPADRYGTDGDASVYEIDPGASLAAVYVYRAGALSRIGHDHVVAARDIEGFVRLQERSGGRIDVEADLYAALGDLTVDEPELRVEAGFDSRPSAEDIEGTRGNMLQSLDAGNFPFVAIAVSARLPRLPDDPTDVDAEVRVRLHGVTRSYPVPVTVRVARDRLYAAGEFSIEQSDFRIRPFSVFGGALRVRDQLDIRFDIAADRQSGGEG